MGSAGSVAPSDRLGRRPARMRRDGLRPWVAEHGVTDPVWIAALVGAVRDRIRGCLP